MGHQNVSILKPDGTGLTEFQEGENFSHFCILNYGNIGMPETLALQQPPFASCHIGNVAIDARHVGIPAQGVQGQDFCPLQGHDKGCLTADSGIDGGTEGFSVVVGKGIGDKALAAVGNTGSVNFLILGFAMVK